MFENIGGAHGIGGPLPKAIGGENFIRHIGNDKLIYDFHEGSGATVHDRSHCGNDGAFGAGAAAPTWKRNSLYFDGGDWVSLTGINHGISTGEFTFCFFLNNLDNFEVPFDQQTFRFFFYVHLSSDYFLFYGTDGQTISDVGITSLSPIDLQITRDISGNLECYVNGKSQNKGSSDNKDLTYNGTLSIRFGSKYEGSQPITSVVYSFRILNKCLSGIEAQNEYLVNKFGVNN